MSCSNPLYALKLYDYKDEQGNPKVHLKFLPKREGYSYSTYCDLYGADNVMMLPCGKCDCCIETRTKQWAARCVLEASCHYKNSFVTLTYRNTCLPKFGLCKKDIQDFMKRLRKINPGQDIRYFFAGEYGKQTKRPHYHAIIFGWCPDDLEFYKKGDFGGNLYSSKMLSYLWPFGNAFIGEVTYASCGYVARYCQKKLKDRGENYKEFSLMSLRPAIGLNYFKEHYKDIYNTDKIYFNFGNVYYIKPFRYFDRLFSDIDEDKMKLIKDERISKANLLCASEMLRLSIQWKENLLIREGKLKSEKLLILKRGDL